MSSKKDMIKPYLSADGSMDVAAADSYSEYMPKDPIFRPETL